MRLFLSLVACSVLTLVVTAGVHATPVPQLQDVPPHTGILITPSGSYQFTTTACAAGVEDGEVDAEVYGPGTAPDGEIIFFSFSSTANEMSIELGKDTMIGAAEREIAAGQYKTEGFVTELSGQTIMVRELILASQDGQRLEGSANLLINCAMPAAD